MFSGAYLIARFYEPDPSDRLPRAVGSNRHPNPPAVPLDDKRQALGEPVNRP